MTEPLLLSPQRSLGGCLGKSSGSCPKPALMLSFIALFRKPKPREVRGLFVVTPRWDQARGSVASLCPRVGAPGLSSVGPGLSQPSRCLSCITGETPLHQLSCCVHPPCCVLQGSLLPRVMRCKGEACASPGGGGSEDNGNEFSQVNSVPPQATEVGKA